MGSGASSGIAEAVAAASQDEINGMFKALNDEQKKKVMEALSKSAAPKMKGKVTIHNVWKVPPAEEEAWDKLWKEHEVWMRKTHYLVGVTPANDGPKILEYAILKGKELTDPQDPSKGETGKILYIMVEVYDQLEGIAQHMALATSDDAATNWPGMATLVESTKKDVEWPISQAGQCSIITCMSDDSPPFQPKAGQSTITMCLKAPKSKEAELDALYASHEKFMRATHSTKEDGAEPKLVTFYIAKGNPPIDAMDASKGVNSEELFYIMSECYYTEEGPGKHMEAGAKEWGAELGKMQEFLKDYGMYMQMNCKVLTSMT